MLYSSDVIMFGGIIWCISKVNQKFKYSIMEL